MARPNRAIVGTVGVPGNYGGFETLAENLVRFHHDHSPDGRLIVYCSANAFEKSRSQYLSAELCHIGLDANGPQSVAYDVISLADAVRRRADVILLLGVSGALALPLLRAISRARILTNIDGIEWKREKWSPIARFILRLSERAAVRWSHVVIADNDAIVEHVRARYNADCRVIAYGGDHALASDPVADPSLNLPATYALALCRIEPENNVAMILEAFARMPEQDLVFVGNWNNSEHARGLRDQYRDCANIRLLDPVYDPGRLRWIREQAWAYVHGHSAGGTNPSLVEMMHFAVPIFAHGCSFNRFTTEEAAVYFEDTEELVAAVQGLDPKAAQSTGRGMREIAERRYTWAAVGRDYFDLMQL